MRLIREACAMLVLLFLTTTSLANPYPDPNAVPQDELHLDLDDIQPMPFVIADPTTEGLDVMRVEIGWLGSETFQLSDALIEASGTEALYRRAQVRPPYGSFVATIEEASTGQILFYDSIGTGQNYKELSRAMTFRFPVPASPVVFRMYAEHTISGVRQEAISFELRPQTLRRLPIPATVVRALKAAETSQKLIVNIYAEGYAALRENEFVKAAQKAVQTLKDARLPMFEYMEFRSVFAPSNRSLGSAQRLGLPVPVFNSFLGLYFPYWTDSFTRWYHVVYPTSEFKYRSGLAASPYDYPIIIVDSDQYWGVGNLNELTAVPAQRSQFGYLLKHEIGHFFGLNEEYEGGGPTELLFARDIDEPWSQNITFHPKRGELKWQIFVNDSTPLPTPSGNWNGAGSYGAYRGGYGDSQPRNKSHKPGYSCVMESGSQYCPICRQGITTKVRYDLGLVLGLPSKNR